MQSVETPEAGPYSGNGVTTAFAYTFYIDDDNDIEVALYDSSGVKTVQTKTTHYTVSGVGVGSGNVTFVTAPASGETVRLRRIQPLENNLNLPDGGDFDASDVEALHDKMVRMIQDLEARLDRAIHIPVGDATTVELPAIADRASKYLSLDASGNLVASVAVSGVSVVGTPAAGEVLAWNVSGYYEPVSNATAIADGDYGDITVSSSGTVFSIDPTVIDYGTLAAALLSGSDTTLITGTAGSANDLAMWNADGDLVAATAEAVSTLINGSSAAMDDFAGVGNLLLDEDTMSSDSATRGATQQSIKAYVDSNAGGGVPDAVFQDQKASGTHGGSSSATTNHTRDLNTSVRNTITGASLASNQITLPAGTYYIEFETRTFQTNVAQGYLYNTSDSAVEIDGTTAQSSSSDGCEDHSHGSGVITLASSKTLELRMYSHSAKATNGLGYAATSLSSGAAGEVYSTVRIWEV